VKAYFFFSHYYATLGIELISAKNILQLSCESSDSALRKVHKKNGKKEHD